MTEEESKAQKAKASPVIETSKEEAPPRDKEGKLRIMTPIVSYKQPQALDMQSQGTETKVTTKGGMGTAAQTSPILPMGDSSTIRAIPLVESKCDPEPDPSESANPIPAVTMPPHSSPASPVLEISPPPTEATPVSGDVLLPMIIFSVVKTNPPHLVSNLLYTQRFRNQSVGGEESYCLINLMAVAEFLENVDLAALGLGDSDKVMRYIFFFFGLVAVSRACADGVHLCVQRGRPNADTVDTEPDHA